MTDHNHNDPLERFFRKKAGEYNIQYKEEDWLKLEGRLDNLDKQHADRRRRRLAAAAVIFLFSILAYFTYQQQQKINQLNERLSNSEKITNPNGTLLGVLPDQIPSQNSGKKQLDKTRNQDPNGVDHSNQEPVIAARDKAVKSTDLETTKEAKTTTASQDIAAEDLSTDLITETGLVATSAKYSPGFDGRYPAISAIRPSIINARTSYNGPQETRSSPVRRSDISQTPRFTIGVLAGPDLSTVGGVSNFYDPGHKLGLLAEYHIGKNLAISVGAIRSKVRYVASGNEYQPPQGYWTYGTSPDNTLGECILIDIPVSLKYDFWHFDDSRLYATAGLSSYIMLDEDYKFNYTYSSPGQQQRWHERTGTSYWMSNATLSFGYELDIAQNLSVRAEPYLRIPLQEVGWGNVKLYSIGSFVSLNYHIN